MPLSEPVREIRRLARMARVGALVVAEQAVDRFADGYHGPDDRAVALDILLRDLARLRTLEPGLDRLIAEVERYIDGLHRDLRRDLAPRRAA